MSAAERVYRALCTVPKGTVVTYGDLAAAAGIENGQRAVGRIMAANPYPGIVPCHRVVRADGRIGGYRYGEASKRAMLEREGVAVGTDGRVAGFGDGTARFRFGTGRRGASAARAAGGAPHAQVR